MSQARRRTTWMILGMALVVSACASPLHRAAERGDIQAMRTLLDQGADVNAKDYGEGLQTTIHPTALHVAAEKGRMEAMTLLLDRGANINARDRFSFTPLHYANKSVEASQLLLDRGADVNAKNYFGWTPLAGAASQGNVQVVELLLNRGADINAKADSGETALHAAAKEGKVQVVQLLLERGALVDEKNAEGKTPAALAREKGHTAVVRLLDQVQAQQFAAARPIQTVPETGLAAPLAMAGPISDVDQPPAGRPAKRNRYAIVVGVEQYRTKLPKADFAAQDAKIMGAYLTKTMGFAEENVAILVNENATRTDLEKYIEHWLPNRVEKDSTVFIYYSGHGAPNSKTGDAYLVPYDGDPAFVEATGYPLKRLYAQLGKLPAKEVVVLLDSCFSGAGGRSVIAKGMRPMVLSMENPVLAGGKTVVLAASKGDQVSSTYDQKGHGLLTYYFLKGLQGEADVNKDGSVDLGEVYDYVKPQVERTARREYNNDQTPQLLSSPGLPAKGVRLIDRPGSAKP